MKARPQFRCSVCGLVVIWPQWMTSNGLEPDAGAEACIDCCDGDLAESRIEAREVRARVRRWK